MSFVTVFNECNTEKTIVTYGFEHLNVSAIQKVSGVACGNGYLIPSKNRKNSHGDNHFSYKYNFTVTHQIPIYIEHAVVRSDMKETVFQYDTEEAAGKELKKILDAMEQQ